MSRHSNLRDFAPPSPNERYTNSNDNVSADRLPRGDSSTHSHERAMETYPCPPRRPQTRPWTTSSSTPTATETRPISRQTGKDFVSGSGYRPLQKSIAHNAKYVEHLLEELNDEQRREQYYEGRVLALLEEHEPEHGHELPPSLQAETRSPPRSVRQAAKISYQDHILSLHQRLSTAEQARDAALEQTALLSKCLKAFFDAQEACHERERELKKLLGSTGPTAVLPELFALPSRLKGRDLSRSPSRPPTRTHTCSPDSDSASADENESERRSPSRPHSRPPPPPIAIVIPATRSRSQTALQSRESSPQSSHSLHIRPGPSPALTSTPAPASFGAASASSSRPSLSPFVMWTAPQQPVSPGSSNAPSRQVQDLACFPCR